MLRGKQIVVAGDMMQLPPTSFFQVTGDAGELQEGEDDLDTLESILGEFIALPQVKQTRLQWHYRSHHESLVQFSNSSYYNDSLITFPSPVVDSHYTAVRYIHIDGTYDRGRSRQNVAEAAKVVDLIAEHMHQHAGARSLGVITLSIAQEQAIRDEINDRLAIDAGPLPAFSAFVDEDADHVEPFFIKSLERVQGDERDHIIMSVGYGPDESGKVNQNFGPINQEGGERRLNVAVTRARMEMAVVTSLKPGDIRLTEQSKQGPRDLKRYLSYAQSASPESQSAQWGSDRYEEPFSRSVHNVLTEAGYHIDINVGMGNYRIDLAVRHPDEPHRYLVAIDTDGEAYSRVATARDRERLRQENLRRLGWRTHRIWSSDWSEHRSTAITDLLRTIEDLRDESIPRLVVSADAVKNDASRPFDVVADATFSTDDEERWRESIRLRPYTQYRSSRTYSRTTFLERRSQLIQQIVKIVAVEQPIHVDMLYQRVIGCYKLHGVDNSSKRATFDKRLAYAVKNGDLVIVDEFVCAESTPGLNQIPRVAGDRSEQYIALEELAALAVQILPHVYGINREGLTRATSKLLDFKVLTVSRRERIESAIDLMIEKGWIQMRGESRLLVPEADRDRVP